MNLSEKDFKKISLRIEANKNAAKNLNISENQQFKESVGEFYVNQGTPSNFDAYKKVQIDYSRRYYMFDVIPMGAPRMTQADKWKTNPNHPDPNYRQREVVTRYFQVKNTMLWQAVQMKFELGDVLEAIYFLPMPDSWSQKKKDAMIGTIHDSKPDVDNISKLCQDVFKKDDSAVWWNNCRKYWAYTGAILIYQ